VPQIPHQVGDRLAGVNVDKLCIDYDCDTGLRFGDIFADILAEDVYIYSVKTGIGSEGSRTYRTGQFLLQGKGYRRSCCR
jgi:hypothetical protein